MMKPSFKQLVEILSTTEGIHIRSERFVAVPVDHCERSTLESALKAAGYSEAAQVNSDAHVFSLSAGAWNELPPIYKDEESFWEANGTAGFVPEHFYIISSGASSLDEDVPFIKSVFLIFKTRSLINKVADHYISSDQKALFFVKYVVSGPSAWWILCTADQDSVQPSPPNYLHYELFVEMLSLTHSL